MKKIKIKISTAGLQFSKEKIVELNNQEIGQVNGGLTYSLSLGALCQKSKDIGATNPYDCGATYASIANNCPSRPQMPN